jgi:NADH dehydrogenase
VIFVAGGTGRLGTGVVRLLVQQGRTVRVLTRDRSRAEHLTGANVEIVEGDVRDAAAVRRAVDGVGQVVSAIHGFAGTKNQSPATIDRDGNHILIQAAREAGVEHLVLLSVKDAAPNHPMDLMRMKYAAEQDLKTSGLDWTIIRPSAYMETWCDLLGRPLLEKGRTQIFGRGRNPINWVSTTDVARFVELAIVDPTLRGEVLEVGGPENLTMSAFVEVFQTVTGTSGKVTHIPPIAMRLTAVTLGMVNPGLVRQIRAGIVMDTRSQAFDATETRRRFPSIPMTSLGDVITRDFALSKA